MAEFCIILLIRFVLIDRITHYLNPARAAISKLVQNFSVAQKLAELQPFSL